MKQCKIILLLVLSITLSSPSYASKKPEKAKSEKTQCVATTKKGNRCKLEVVEGSKYCPVHYAQDPNAEKCKAMTKKGTRCTRAAKVNGYCTQHAKKK